MVYSNYRVIQEKHSPELKQHIKSNRVVLQEMEIAFTKA
jgi:hypothetical protein